MNHPARLAELLRTFPNIEQQLRCARAWLEPNDPYEETILKPDDRRHLADLLDAAIATLDRRPCP